MKKIKKILISLCLALLLPLGLVLTACGATPSNEVRGVFFESDFYDEETGYAIFELDQGRATKLEYKVNPSSWSGYVPEYQVIKAGESEENRPRFKLENGEVTINSSDFEEITVQITINDFSDICIVRLKKYPTKIFFINGEGEQVQKDYKAVSSNTVHQIHVFGQFGGETEPRELSEEHYKFNVVSSNDTTVKIFNPTRLTLFTVKTRPERAEIKVELLNADGKSVFAEPLTLTVDVIPLITNGMLLIDGYDDFIDGTETEPIEISVSGTTSKNGKEYYVLSYKAYAFGEAEAGSEPVYFDEEIVDFDIVVMANNLNVSSDYGSREIYIDSSLAGTELELTFWFGLNTVGFKPFSINISVILQNT